MSENNGPVVSETTQKGIGPSFTFLVFNDGTIKVNIFESLSQFSFLCDAQAARAIAEGLYATAEDAVGVIDRSASEAFDEEDEVEVDNHIDGVIFDDQVVPA